MFIEELPLLVAELKSAIARHAFDEIKRSAHRFKGETLNFACRPLESCLINIERGAAEEDRAIVLEEGQRLDALCALLHDALNAKMEAE